MSKLKALKTGLFSSIVATFIALSLPQLSPDPNIQAIALLTQLVNISSGSPVVVQSTPFKAPASIVRVNIMWFLSLILSLSCALLATLMQQWARRYLGYAQHRGTPLKQVHIRAYMLDGVEKFSLSRAVETMPVLLHSSVFLFFAGLIEFLFTINKVVAFSALGCVAVFAFIYAILTLAPNWRLNCPYRTPLSGFTFRLFQLSGSSLFSVAATMEGIFHGLLLEIWRRFHSDVRGSLNNGPIKWREMLKRKVDRHYKRFRHGLRWSVKQAAMDAPSMIDASALHDAMLIALDGDKEFEDFVANMPGLFDSHDTPDVTWTMLSLLSKHSASDPILGSRLHEFLKTCVPGSSFLSEEQRKNRLRVCLTSLWYCARAYNLPENSRVPLSPYVRAIFASPEVISRIQTEEDPVIRLLGRCFWSLVVKKLTNDITLIGTPPTTAELAYLSFILGATGQRVWGWLDHKGPIDLATVTFLVSGELETLIDDGTSRVPADVMDIFQQTLGILAEGMFSRQADIEWDTDHVTQIHEIYFKLTDAPVPDELKELLRYIWVRLPPSYT